MKTQLKGNYHPVGVTYDIRKLNRKDCSMSKFERRNRTNADYRYQDDETDRTFRGERNRDYNYDERMSRRGQYSSGYGSGLQGGRSQMQGDYDYGYQGGQASNYGYSEDEDMDYQSGQSGYGYGYNRGYQGGQSSGYNYGRRMSGMDERGESEYGYRSGMGSSRRGRGSEYGSPYQGGRTGGQGMSYRRGQSQYGGQGSFGGSQYQSGQSGSQSDNEMDDYIYDWETDYDYEGPYVGRGPEGYQRSDERIQEEVSEMLMWNGDVDASKIRVSVNNGEVTLKGTVEDRWQKRMAVDVAHDVRGVKDVHNELRIHVSSDTEGQEYTDSSATKGQGQGSSQTQGGSSSRSSSSGTSSSNRSE
jgi:osmotically-inducible protein OsmY